MNDYNKSNAELIAELVALRQGSQRDGLIKNLVEGMPVGFALCEIILDKQGNPIDYRFIFTNSEFEKQTGLNKTIIGKTAKEIFPDIEQSRIEKYGSVAIDQKPIQFTEFNHITNKQYQVNAYSPSKNIFAVLFQDISANLKIEEKIKTSEKRFRALFEQAGDYCMILDPHTEDGIPVIVDANKAAYKQHGYTREEFIGRPVADIDDDEGKQLVVERTQAIMRGELRNLETTHLRKDGTTFPVAIHANRIDIEGEPSLIFTTEYDITKRKQTEDALIKSEERFRAITANTLDHIILHDRELRYLMVINPQLGLTEEDMLGKTDYDFLPKEEADTLVEAKKQVLESGKSLHFSTSLMSTTGDQEFFDGTFMPTLDTQNQPNGLVGYFRNVTESKRAEEEIIKQKNMANNYLNIVGSIMIALNLEGEITLLNKKGHEILGYEEGELYGKNWFSTCLPKETSFEVKEFFEALMTGEMENLETHENEIIRKDGQKRIVKWFNALVRDDLGNITGVLSSGEDITEAREKEELLKTSEANLKKAQQVANLGSWSWYIPDNRLVWSDEMYRIFEVEQEKFTGDLADVMETAIHPDDRAAVEQSNLSVINEGKPIPLEYRVITPEGNTKTVWAEAGELVVDEAGNPILLTGIVQDISERTQAEKALKHSHDLLSYIIEHSQSGVAVHDRELNYIYVSKNYLEQYNVQESDVIGKHHYEVFPDLPQKWRDVHQKALAGEISSADKDPYPREDGTVDWTRWECRPWHEADGSIGGIIVYTEVITEQVEAEEELKRNLETLTLGEDIANLGYFERNWKSGKGFWSKGFYKLLGENSENVDCEDEEFTQYVHPEDLQQVQQHIQTTLKNHTNMDIQFRLIQSDGNIIHIHAIGKNFYDEFDKPLKTIGTFQDITKKVEAENEIREHVTFLDSTMEQSPFSMWISDVSGTIIKTNKILRKTLNLTDDQLIGKYNVFKDGNLNKQGVMPLVKKVFSHFQPARFEIPWSGESTGIEAYTNASSLWLDVSMFPIMDVDGKLRNVVCQWVDITDRKQAEAEKLKLESYIRQQQKLESIGTLASGVAHEINNPITGIMNYAQLISERLNPDQKQLKEFSEGVIIETKRVAEIVRNLLTFSRNDKEEHSPARIEDIVEQTLSLIRTIIKRDQIELNVDIPDNLPKLKCRSQQIQQVLMNLLTNARDALNLRYPEYDADKIISVKVRQFEKDGRRWLRTTIEDHGSGIPHEIRERIFDPFFTTKDRAIGTGLGLSISLGLVKDHHGELTFECEENEYTRFYLDLPVDNGWDIE